MSVCLYRAILKVAPIVAVPRSCVNFQRLLKEFESTGTVQVRISFIGILHYLLYITLTKSVS